MLKRHLLIMRVESVVYVCVSVCFDYSYECSVILGILIEVGTYFGTSDCREYYKSHECFNR